jgi:hypothetical protein
LAFRLDFCFFSFKEKKKVKYQKQTNNNRSLTEQDNGKRGLLRLHFPSCRQAGL